jgi:DNA-binding transcriptional LysR family regulator
MQISLRQIQYFLAAAETGQFSAAAAKVHVTQTAVTAAIKELESALGVKLFRRHHAAGVSLTLNGHRFLHHAHGIAAAVHAATRDPGLVEEDLAGTVLLGTTHSVLGSYLVPALARFVRAYPRVDLQILEFRRPALERALRAGELDVGAAWLDNVESTSVLSRATLARSRRQLWTCANHPLLERREVTLEAVAKHPYVLYDQDDTPRSTLSFWKRSGLSPNVRYRVTSIEALRSLVAQGLAVTILSDVIYRPFSGEGLRIEARPLLDSLPTIEVGMLWKTNRKESAPAAALRRFLRATLTGPAEGAV